MRARDPASVILASAVPVHVVLALATDLTPDEAYYLCAARASQSIADHPPLTLWMLAATDPVAWAPVELRVRVWAILFSFLTSLALVALARARGADRAGTSLVAWVSTWALLPMAGGFVTTPDTPLLLLVALALLTADSSPVLAGAALFGGALAKVIAIPVGAMLAVGRAGRRSRSALLMTRGPTSGWHAAVLFIGPLFALPLLIPSLRFQLRHAFVGGGPWSIAAAATAMGAAIGAQMALWSPLALWDGGRAVGMPASHRILAGSMTALVVVSAIVRGVPPEPNWWAPAALVVVAGLGVAAKDMSRARRRLLLAMVIAPTVVALAHTLRPFLPLTTAADPTARLHGWRHGDEPSEAPGLGVYGVAAERCIYRGACSEIAIYFETMNQQTKSP